MPAHGENWSRAELKEALRAYLQVVAWEKSGTDASFSPTELHRDLARRALHPRTVGSIGRRMSNITVVLAQAGERVTRRYKGVLTHVGPGPTGMLLDLLRELQLEAVEDVADPSTLADRANVILASGPVARPMGNKSPPKREAANVSQYLRDPKVVAWVLQECGGLCEACGNAAPFSRTSGQPYLEVHHLRHLADNGPDVVENTIATCPNCHRRLHYSHDRAAFRRKVLKRVGRLVST